MDGAQWYYALGDQQIGPVPLETLKQLAATGEMDASTLVWRDGMAAWIPAEEVPGILEGERVVKRRPMRAGATPQRRSRITAVDSSFDRDQWAAAGLQKGTPWQVTAAAVIDFLGGLGAAYMGFALWKVAGLWAEESVEQETINLIWWLGLLFVVCAACLLAEGVALLMRWGPARILQMMLTLLFVLLATWLLVSASEPLEREEEVVVVPVVLLIVAGALPLLLVLPSSVADWFSSAGHARRRGPFARRSRVKRKKIVG